MSNRLVGKQPPRKRLRTKQQEGTSEPAASARREEASIAAAASKYDDTLRKIYYDAREGLEFSENLNLSMHYLLMTFFRKSWLSTPLDVPTRFLLLPR